jgi:2-polyprenyl-3-methyl-5-hydroxy-6-metoxy-1,4-benzoquinol methylase
MYHALILDLIKQFRVRRVCDIGGGANPTLPLETVHALGLEYTLLDISADELAKAPAGYRKVEADITQKDAALPTGFDLVISMMLAEHVRDGRAFHENVRDMLAPGGVACHFFPTLYSLPLLANRLVPERLASRLLDWFAPRDDRHRKFPAYYSWCRGPSRRQIRRFERMGYKVLAYRGFFGHDYYVKVPLLRSLHRAFSDLLVRYPVPQLTSRAQVVLQRVA